MNRRHFAVASLAFLALPMVAFKPREEHGIGWALHQVSHGQSVYRPDWNEGEWIQLQGDQVYIQNGTIIAPWTVTEADIEATDWQIVPID